MFRLRVRKFSPIPQEPIECPLNIGYLGKIPQRDDFIELNARSREVQDLDACLKQWYLDTHRRGVDPRSAYRHFGFVATGGHDRQGLAGHFYSSSDRYDRAYPILYFARWSSVSMYFRPAVLFHATEQTLPSLSSVANSFQVPDMDFLANLSQLAEQPNPLIAENPVLDAMGGLTMTYLNEWLEAR